MRKSVTKIVKAVLGFAMAIGAGVGTIFSSPKANPVFAANASIAFDFTASYSGVNASGSVTKNELYETTSDFNSTYTFYYINCYSGSGYLMCGSKAKGAASLFANKTAMPGDIVRVTITPSSGCSTSASWKLSTGTSAFTTALSTGNKTSTGKNAFYYEPTTTTNIRYFGVTSSSTSYNGQIASISVTYVSQQQTYTVTYDANGGTGTTPTEDAQFEANANVTAKFPSNLIPPTDKVFKNWRLNNSSTGTEINARASFEMPSQNSTLFANWVDKPESVTFDAASDLGGSTSTGVGAYKLGISIDATTGVMNGGTNYQFYKNSVVTFSSYYNISKIEFTNVNSDPISNFTVDVGTLSGTRWTGKAKTITFTASVAQVKTPQIVVTYELTTPYVELNHTSLELKTSQIDGLQVEAVVHNVDAPTYSWAADNDSVSLENANTSTVTIKPNISIDGSSNVTLTVGGVTPNLTATVEVTISIPGPGETAGTAYTVAQASAAIAGAASNIENIYITGKISQIDEISTAYHNATYWISDNGTKTNQFKIYHGKYLDNANFTSEDQLYLGDTVVIYGTLSKQYSNLDSGNYLVSLTPAPRVTSVTLTPSSINVAPGASGAINSLFTNIVINQEDGSNKTAADIVWTSDDENVFCIIDDQYIAGDTHRSSTTIHASLDEKVFASVNIVVFNPNAHSITYNLPEQWMEVSDPSTLVPGDQVILTGVKSGVVRAATTYSSGNNVKPDTNHFLTITNGIATGVQPSMIYTLEAGTEPGSVAFKDSGNKYLYAASSSSNNMKSQNEIDDNASFIISADGNVLAQGSNTRNNMRYNESSDLFSCYEGTVQTAIKFYKLDAPTDEVDLFNLTPVSTAYDDGNETYVRLGVTLSEEDWAAMDAAFGIAGYGVMLLRETTLEGAGFNSIEEVYRSESLSKPNLSNLSKASDVAPADFSVVAKINITNDSNRSVVFCAATYVISDSGAIYFINETRGSLVDLLP